MQYLTQLRTRDGRARVSVEDRGFETPCWVWQLTRNPCGYGTLKSAGRTFTAHTFYWRQVFGDVPNRLSLDHLCRVRACVNPLHMEAVTHAENMRRSGPAQKTHCKNGHEFTPENTYIRTCKSGGRRDCRACIRERARRYRGTAA